MKILYSVLILIIALHGIIFLACSNSDNSKQGNSSDDDDYDDDDSDDDDDDDDEPDHAWTDPDTGFMWQLNKIVGLHWDKSYLHCSALEFAGYDDWRLPTISELRTLIRGCGKTITGGECKVTDSCTSRVECWNSSSCGGCHPPYGPSENGNYWPDVFDVFTGWSTYFWSSTIPEDDDEGRAWSVAFSDASIIDYYVYNSQWARCVRDSN